MVSLKSRRTEPLSVRHTNVYDAVADVLTSSSQQAYAVGEYEVSGTQRSCSVGDTSFDVCRDDVVRILEKLRAKYGRRYKYTVTIYGDRPERTHTQQSTKVIEDGLTPKQYEEWLVTDEARVTRYEAWWITLTPRSA